MSEGKKYDQGKPRYDLIPPEALDELARLYQFGAGKYADRNWEKGLKTTRIFAALMRHAWAWMRGEDNDKESGLPHMASVAWCAFAIITFSKRRRTDLDDRPKRQRPKSKRNLGGRPVRTELTITAANYYCHACGQQFSPAPVLTGSHCPSCSAVVP